MEDAEVIGLDGRSFSVAPIDTNATNYLNRELSWLSFNARVLALAKDVKIPLLERLKFVAIYAGNLDEFFQVRVAGLHDLVAAGVRFRGPDGRTPEEQLREIRKALQLLEEQRQQIFTEQLVPQLALQGIEILDYEDLDADDLKVVDEYFDEQVFPILTPLGLDPGHPFPYISDLSLNLGVRVRQEDDDRTQFARIKIPDLVDRFVETSRPGRFVLIENLVLAHLGQLFPGLEVEEYATFRVTRNADLNYREEEADDLLELVEMELRRRRFGGAVRLEMGSSNGDSVRGLLRRELDLEETDIYTDTALLSMVDLWAMLKMDRTDLRYDEFVPVIPARISKRPGDEVDLFETLRKRDLLVHHPYESFAETTQELIRRAARDPDVVAIKMTLYRTASDSAIVRALVRAAEKGKQVAVLIELKARFDERANIEWAKTLEQAGVHVTYGLTGLKIHAKITMIVRREAGRLVRYCHFGTGNYNDGTARLYGDFSLMTASEKLGDELAVVFNTLTGYGGQISYDDLLVAPDGLRTGLSELIRQEMRSEHGRIIMKMNSLVDPGMIGLLYEASQSGVEIDLIVRGMCSLRAGVKGLSDNIRVRSIIGRYLEHARVYHFGNGGGPGTALTYMGSADLMQRNLDHRVETLVLLDEPAVAAQVLESLAMELAPNSQSWYQDAEGGWVRSGATDLPDLHESFEKLAQERRRAGKKSSASTD